MEQTESVKPVIERKHNDDLGNFFTRFFKVIAIHRWLFLFILLLVTALVIWFGLRQPKVYLSEYEVFYNETMKEFVDDSNVPVMRSDFDKNYWVRAMVSDELMRMTIENSGLVYTPGGLKKLISVSQVDKRREDRIPVFKVSILNQNREHIPILIKAYIKALNALLVQYQVGNSDRLVRYFNDQIAQSNTNLAQIDLQIMAAGSGESGAVEIVDYDKIKASLDEFRKELLQAKVNLSSIRAARIKTQAELRNLDGTIINESAFSEPLKVQLMNLEVDLARSLTKQKEDHPTVKQIRQNIVQISNMLRDSIEQRLEIKSYVANPLKSQLMSRLLELQISEVSESTRLESLEKVIKELELRTLPDAVNQDHQQMLRNREMLFITLKQLNDRLIEAQSASHGSLSRFVYIDDPGAIFLANKGVLYYAILAALLGIVLASVFVFVYDLLDDRIMMVDDFEHFYPIPLIGTVRHYANREADWKSKASLPDYAHVQNMSSLVINLRQFIRRNELKSLVVASPERQEGKSYLSLKLATALAFKKQKILLVDMDFFAPRITHFIQHEPHPGLSNFIVGDISLEKLIQPTEVEGLYFAGAGNAEGRKDLFYNDVALSRFVEWARNNFDVVIYDTPAVTYIPDIFEFFDSMDAILLVIRLRMTTRKSITRMLKSISNFKTTPISAIINDVYSKAAGSTQYSYEYQYSQTKTETPKIEK